MYHEAVPVRLYSSRLFSKTSSFKLPPLHFIFIHGFLSQGGSLLSVARRLHEACAARLLSRAVEFVAIDCRNHGRSPHTTRHTLDDIVLDLREWLLQNGYCAVDGLQADGSVPPTVVAVGHSMGSMVWTKYLMDQQGSARQDGQASIAALLSLDMPPLTRRLVPSSLTEELHGYINIMKSVDLLAIKDMRSAREEFARCGIKEERLQGFFSTNINIFRSGEKAKPSASWRCNVPVLEESLCGHSIFLPDDFDKRFLRRRIEVPVLSILGGLSPIGRSEHCRGYWRRYAERVDEHVLPNSGHNVYYDDVKATTHLMESFVRNLGLLH